MVNATKEIPTTHVISRPTFRYGSVSISVEQGELFRVLSVVHTGDGQLANQERPELVLDFFFCHLTNEHRDADSMQPQAIEQSSH